MKKAAPIISCGASRRHPAQSHVPPAADNGHSVTQADEPDSTVMLSSMDQKFWIIAAQYAAQKQMTRTKSFCGDRHRRDPRRLSEPLDLCGENNDIV
jgi:hypothetical protein